jgi:N-methylhydantoinase A/oxoprolinase/acetone carboxylase beta subunit
MTKYIIGIDIGSTNTDAVIIDQNKQIINFIKTPTTIPFDEGFKKAITHLIKNINVAEIVSINLGTTHAINAILEAKNLTKVGLLNLAGHNPKYLPATFKWDENLQTACFVGEVSVNGGFECDGTIITSLQTEEVISAIHKLLEMGAETIAVCGVFSPLYNLQELQVATIIKEHFSNISYTLSSEVGSIGIVERTNAAILNCALGKIFEISLGKLEDILKEQGITAKLLISKNNGTLMPLDEAIKFPIFTIGAGPTNSFVGGAAIVGTKNAIVVDIGGTSTDCGIILNGLAKKSSSFVSISGAKLNYAMPDIVSIALGGGSILSIDYDIKIGPKSVGKDLLTLSKSFGGDTLTLTDYAIKNGFTNLPNANQNLFSLEPATSQLITLKILELLNSVIRKISGSKFQDLDVIFVGGGTSILPDSFFTGKFKRPNNFQIANAYGAALAPLSETFDTMIDLENDEVMTDIEQTLFEKLIFKGASKQNIIIAEKEVVPLGYSGNLARVIITATGF